MTMAALQQAGGETTGYSQENRLLQANIPLKRSNGDSLLLESFSGMEGVSSLFSFDLVLHSLDSTLTLNDLSGLPLSTLSFNLATRIPAQPATSTASSRASRNWARAALLRLAPQPLTR